MRLSPLFLGEKNFEFVDHFETATTTLAIDPSVFNGAVGNAVQLMTDNGAVLAYVFGIPLFFILVAVVMDWIKGIKKENADYKKIKAKPMVDEPYLYDEKGKSIGKFTYDREGHIVGGKRNN